MNKMFSNTIGALSKREQSLEKELNRIRTAREALETGAELVYEVHFQTYWPDHRSIMAEGVDLFPTLEKAKGLWLNYNGKSQRPNNSCAEVFVRASGLRIAIMPHDAACVASLTAGKKISTERFTLDERVTEPPHNMVFDQSRKNLPSAWYTLTPTPPFAEKEEVSAVPA